MSKISFVMPTYNRDELIGESIQTILDQTIDDWELVVVNDHSDKSDKTSQIIEDFGDDRIKYHVLPDLKGRGVSCARNFGNLHAKGELIAVCDSDDLYDPDWGKLIIESYKKESWDLCYGKYLVLKPDGEVATSESYKNEQIDFNLQIYQKRNFIPHGGSSYPRKIAMHYPYNSSFNRGEDRDMFSRMVADGKKFYFCDKVVYKYRLHEESITSGTVDKNVEAEIIKNRGWSE